MKLNNAPHAAALLAVGMTIVMAGCAATGSSSEAASSLDTSAADSADAASAAASAIATGEDAYAYLADFSYDAPFDDKGYVSGVKASDYVTLADGYDKITLPESLATVSDEEITTYIEENILSGYLTTSEVTDRAAADGDTVKIDYLGKVGGVPFTGGDSRVGYDGGVELTLGSGRFIDGFEEQIVGHKPGETFDITVTFPDGYSDTTDADGNAIVLSNAEAVFTVELHSILEDVTPELNDAWVKDNLNEEMGFATVTELRDFVKNTMLFDNQSSEIYSALLEKATFKDELPQVIHDFYRDAALYSIYQYAQQYGMSVDEFMQAQGIESADTYVTENEASIEGAVHQQLLMQAVAEDKGIVCDTEQLNSNFHRYYGTTDPAQYSAYYGENYVKMTMLHNLVMQYLMDNATFTAE